MPFTSFEFNASNTYGVDAIVRHLSIPSEECEITTLSTELLESIWKKAEIMKCDWKYL